MSGRSRLPPLRLLLVLASWIACARPTPAPVAHEALQIGLPFDITTLDPHAIDRLEHFGLLGNIYEPLVVNDPDLRLRPALATRWENPDATTWVFHLRAARFQDGQPLTSADVAWTIERLKRSPALQIRSYVADVVEVLTPQPGTLVLKTRGRSRTFLSRLTSVSVVRRGSSDASLRDGGNGTGPYEVEAWQTGDSLALRLRADAGTPGLPRQVRFALGLSAQTAVRGLQSGQFDLVRADLRDLDARLPADRFRVVRRENLFTKMLAFDHARARTPHCDAERNPFRDLRVRQAIHLGLDRAALVRRLAHGATPNVQPVPRSVFGFDPALGVPEPDLARARALLAEAGFAQGFAVTLHTRAVHAADAALVATALEPLGLRVRVEVPPDADYFALLAAGGASFWLDRFGCTTGDAAEVLEDLMHTPDPARGLGTLNFGGFSDPDIDRLSERVAEFEAGGGDRRDALQKAMALLVERLPVVSLFNDEDVYGMSGAISIRPRADSYLPIGDIGLALPAR